MIGRVQLREVVEDDLPIFFEQQLDPEANQMAAFTVKDPTNIEAFNAHWSRIMADPSIAIRTIVRDEEVVGHVLSYEVSGKPEVSYWIGKAFWGQGIATLALQEFLLRVNTKRPIYARVAKHNVGSIRVLEKCQFRVIGEKRSHANARGMEIEELVLELGTHAKDDTKAQISSI